MKTKRYSEEQILYALQQTERGEKATEVRRMLGITKQPFCRRKDQHAGKRVGEIRQLKPREEENRKLKQLIGIYHQGVGRAGLQRLRKNASLLSF
jgi:putative transposase